MKTTNHFRIPACVIAVLLTLLIFERTTAQPNIPRLLSWQGVLTDQFRAPVPNGPYNITIRIYDAPTGGTSLWQETEGVTTFDGVFTTLLGDQTPLSIPFDRPYWLSIELQGEAEMTPRIPLVAAPYALNAAHASVADSVTGGMGMRVQSLNGISGSVQVVGRGGTVVTQSGDTLIITSGGSQLPTGTKDGEVIRWNAATNAWESGEITVATAPRLSGNGSNGSPLDIAQMGATDQQVLQWDQTSGTWKPGSISVAANTGAPLQGDGTTGNPLGLRDGSTEGQALFWNGTNWITTSATQPQDGDGFLWDGSSKTWKPGRQSLNLSPRLSGDGTGTAPLDIAGQGATDGQALLWDGASNSWKPGNAFVVRTPPFVGNGSANSPLALADGTNPGQILYWNGTDWRISTGRAPRDGEVLRWNAGAGHWDPMGVEITNNVPLSRGSIWVGGANDTAQQVGIGQANQVLSVNTAGTAPEWTSSLHVDSVDAAHLRVQNDATIDGNLQVNGTRVDLPNGSIDNSELANSSLSVNYGTGLSGDTVVTLGGTLNVQNTGVTSLTGTANQVAVDQPTGNITLTLPQDIHTDATPTFDGLTLDNIITTSNADQIVVSNNGTVESRSFTSLMPGGILPQGTSTNSTLRWDGTNWIENTGVTADDSGNLNTSGNSTVDGDLTVNGTAVNLPNGSIDNAELANNSVNISYGTGLSGDASVTLGGTLNVQNAGVTSANAGTGISLNQSTGGITITNDGVTQLTAGNGITVDQSTGAVTITNNGLLSATGGTGIDVTTTSGTATIINTGVTSLTGTTNQVVVDQSTGGVTLSLPQDIHTDATPMFDGLTLDNINTSSSADQIVVSNSGVLESRSLGSFFPGGLLPQGTSNNSTLRWDGIAWIENTGLTADGSGNTTTTGNSTVGGDLTVSGTNVNLPNGSVDNAELANNSVNINYGAGLSGDASVVLGGTLNVQNDGLLTATAGAGINIATTNGNATITNSGVTSLTGTTNQVIVDQATGGVTLSLPQDIHTDATPTFDGLTLDNINTSSSADQIVVSNSGAIESRSLTSLFPGGLLPQGTTNNTTLRWNGTNWVENTAITADNTGNLNTSGNSTVGGDLTVNGTNVNLPNGSVDNTELANNSVNVSYGTGLSGDASVALGGTLNMQNSGVTSLTGTANQVVVDQATGGVTLSLPQDIHTDATPTFDGLTLDNINTSSSADQIVVSNSGSMESRPLSSFFPGGLLPQGTTNNATLRWDGTAWVENSGLTADGTGNTTTTGNSTVGGDLTVNGTNVSLPNGSVDNTELANSTVNISYGTGLSGDASVALGGTLNVQNSGVTSLTGTANQVVVDQSTGGVTLSLPQDIHTDATPTFDGLTLDNINTSSNATDLLVNNGGSVESRSLASFVGILPLTENALFVGNNSNLISELPSTNDQNALLQQSTTGSPMWTPFSTVVASVADSLGASFWKTNGNAGTNPANHFIGTTDSTTLVIRVKNDTVYRILPIDHFFTKVPEPILIGGAPSNHIAPGSNGSIVAGGTENTIGNSSGYSTISGGGKNRIDSFSNTGTIGGGWENRIAYGGSATIGGGVRNVIDSSSARATIAGGSANRITVDAIEATIAGGSSNKIDTSAWYATIAGGNGNTVNTLAQYGIIAGGSNNAIEANAYNATIGGGTDNVIGSAGWFTTIVGGRSLRLDGARSFGFNANDSPTFAGPTMIIGDSNVAVFGNTDLWLANDRNQASKIKLFEAKNGTGAFPNGTNYSSFEAGTGQTIDIEYILPDTAGIAGDILFVRSVSGNRVTLDWDSVASGPSAWSLTGNAGTNPSGNFLGTTDNQPLVVRVNNDTALRILPGTTPSLIGGYKANSSGSGVIGAVIVGGGDSASPNRVNATHGAIVGGIGNQANAVLSFVGGGQRNTIDTLANESVITGGFVNQIDTGAWSSTIAGGSQNQIGRNSSRSVIAGGAINRIDSASVVSTIGGGQENSIGANTFGSTIGGGYRDTIRNRAVYSVIGGGQGNVIDSAFWSHIGGGQNNRIHPVAVLTTISGGEGNSIGFSGRWATISGGRTNTIDSTADYAAISGGQSNYIGRSSWHSSIGGGKENRITATSTTSTIAGGISNTIDTADNAVISGGFSNSAYADNTTISGGNGNAIQVGAFNSTVGGGTGNSIDSSALASVIAGGSSNIVSVSATTATIGGGENNAIDGNTLGVTIAGGSSNLVFPSSSYSVISGGQNNRVSGGSANTIIAGGSNNTINSFINHAVISGGQDNNNSAFHATISGGQSNSNSGDHAAISGGQSNTVSGSSTHAVIAGGQSNDVGTGANHTAIGGGQDNNIAVSATHTTIGGGQNNDIGSLASHSTIAGGEDNNVATSGRYVVIAGGQDNNIEQGTTHATIAGGRNNTIQSSTEYSTISGGNSNRIGSGYDANVISGGSFNIIDSADYTAIAGGRGLTLYGSNSFGFLANPVGNNNMVVSDSNVVVLGNTDLWLANNDNEQSKLKFFTRKFGEGPYPSSTTYSSFEAPTSQTFSIQYVLPDTAGIVGDVLSVKSVTGDSIDLDWVAGGSGASSWNLTGNAGTDPTNNFIGTTDNQALYIRVNNDTVMRYLPHGVSPTIFGGYRGNSVGANSFASVISGGGNGGGENSVGDNSPYSFIGGGWNNEIGNHTIGNLVGGGYDNTIGDSTEYNVVVGGQDNDISKMADYSSIGGGFSNSILDSASYATISGGYSNLIFDSATYSTIGGGRGNSVSRFVVYGTIAGGQSNQILQKSVSATIGGGVSNDIEDSAHYSVIAGGFAHQIRPNATASVISGGFDNEVEGSANHSTIAGGKWHVIHEQAEFNAIGGGRSNEVEDSVSYSTIGGGLNNHIQPHSIYSVISGGVANTIGNASDRGTIAGGNLNTIWDSTLAATIGGGIDNNIRQSSRSSSIGGGRQNDIGINDSYSVIGGGLVNRIAGNTASTVIAGGDTNNITTGADHSTISGGGVNTIADTATYSVIGGGYANFIGAYTDYGLIAGGRYDTIESGGDHSAILGGLSNKIASGATVSTIAGGYGLTLSGSNSFGFHANAFFGNKDMEVDAGYTAVFGNVNLWLANNDSAARELRFYEPFNSSGAYPGPALARAYFTSFEAPLLNDTIKYILPATKGAAGDVMEISAINGDEVTLEWDTDDNSSDARFKNHIRTLTSALDSTLMLRGVRHNWRHDEFPDRNFPERESIGFIAQEVEQIFPELVETESDGYKKVQYAKVTALLVEALREQQEDIERQESEIKELRALVEKLLVQVYSHAPQQRLTDTE